MLHRRVASCRGVEIFSSLLAFDNYVPSQNYGRFATERTNERERKREEGGKREREKERELRGGFQLVGCLCAPRSREQCRQDYLPRLHFAAVYSSPVEDDSAVLQSSFPQIPIAASSSCPLPFPIRRVTYRVADLSRAAS